MDMFDLENDLPDELMASGTSWGLSDNIGSSKPPAPQGPGPGGLQNGIDGTDGSASLRQQMQQVNHHILQQVSLFYIAYVVILMKKKSLKIILGQQRISREYVSYGRWTIRQ